MIIILFLSILCVMAALGAITSRMCGGGKPDLPWGLDQFVYGLPYLIFGDGYFRLLSYAGAVIGKRLGHGQYHGIFGKRTPPENDEKFDFIVKLFFGEDITGPNRWKRNLFGLFLSGVFPVLIAVVLTAMEGHYLASVILFIGGALKPVTYLVTAKTKYFTAGGEYLTGLFGWATAAIAALIIYHDQIIKLIVV